MLILARKEKEAIILRHEGVTITFRILSHPPKGEIKIGIDAPLSVTIVREEIDGKPYDTRRVA